MKNKDLSFAAFVALILCIIGIVGTMIAYINRLNDNKKEPTFRLPDTAEETEIETETEIVFVEVETEEETSEETTKTIIQDTSEKSPQMSYTDEDVLYLAKVIENEAGSSYCTDEHQRWVASVVINRMNSDRFPGNTILEIALCGYEGIYPIQYTYADGASGFWALQPSARALENARWVLENGVVDETVVWQANFSQGDEIVKEFTYDVDPPTTYICK